MGIYLLSLESDIDRQLPSVDSNEAVYPVRFLVQGMVLFKESLAQWTPVRRNGTINENCMLTTLNLTDN